METKLLATNNCQGHVAKCDNFIGLSGNYISEAKENEYCFLNAGL